MKAPVVFGTLAAAGVALLPSAAGFARANEVWRERSDKVIEGRGLRGLRVENPRGGVSVKRGADANLRLTAVKIVRAGESDRARELAKEIDVITATDDATFVVRVRYPRERSRRVSFWSLFSDFVWPRAEVRLALEVPAGLAVRLRSTSGDLATEGLSGAQDLETTSGDVVVRGAGGPLEASSTSGDIFGTDLGPARLRSVSGSIRVAGARGSVRASATSGSVSVRGAEDSLDVRTVSGDIRVDTAPRGLEARSTSGDVSVRSASGAVRAESASGDVLVELLPGTRRADVSTGSGDIDVAIAGGVGCRLEMRTASGDIDVAVPVVMESVTRRRVSAVVGGGTAPVRLTSASGDVRVRSRGD